MEDLFNNTPSTLKTNSGAREDLKCSSNFKESIRSHTERGHVNTPSKMMFKASGSVLTDSTRVTIDSSKFRISEELVNEKEEISV